MVREAFLVATILSLAGCASQPEAKPLYATVNFVGARDDLWPEMTSAQAETYQVAVGLESVATFAPSVVRKCSQQRDKCKSAVVFNELHYRVTKFDNDTVEVSGNLITKMGRSETFASNSGGMSMSQTETILDGVETLREQTDTRPFQQALKLGRSINVMGFGDSKVTLSFSDKIM